MELSARFKNISAGVPSLLRLTSMHLLKRYPGCILDDDSGIVLDRVPRDMLEEWFCRYANEQKSLNLPRDVVEKLLPRDSVDTLCFERVDIDVSTLFTVCSDYIGLVSHFDGQLAQTFPTLRVLKLYECGLTALNSDFDMLDLPFVCTSLEELVFEIVRVLFIVQYSNCLRLFLPPVFLPLVLSRIEI